MAAEIRTLIETVARRVIAAADELTALDQAIGDGDHGLNMKRGFEAVLADLDAIAAKPAGDALKQVWHDAGDEGRRRVRPALRHPLLRARQGMARDRGYAVDRRGARHRHREGEGARQVRAGSEDDARRPRARPGGRVERRSRRDPGPRRREGGRDCAPEGDPRPGVLPRRPVRRPHGPRRAVQRDHHRRHHRRPGGPENDRLRRHRHRLPLAARRRGRRRYGAPDGGATRSASPGAAATPRAGSAPASAQSWRPSTGPGRRRVSPSSSISAAPRPTARWRSKCCRGAAGTDPHLQRADRGGRRDGGHRSFRRLRSRSGRRDGRRKLSPR